MFPNKLHSSAVQNTFEFDRFFKLQNVVKSRIHFNISKRGAYIRGAGGTYKRTHFFCVRLDGPKNGGGGAYNRTFTVAK